MRLVLPPPRRLRVEDMACIHPNAAGMEMGARAMVVAVPPERDTEPVRVFETCTPDLHAVVDWLLQCGIDTVAMASTGVYWVPVFELAEQHGIHPSLVNARHVKTVPGRTSAGNDAPWLQQLHALGLLQGSCRPDAARGILRTLLRHRAALMAHRAPHIFHRHKALKRMNLPWSAGLTDITGVTGQAILRAIVPGERDPVRLAPWRTAACKSSADVIAKALTGTWRDEQVFMRTHALEFFDFSTRQMTACEAQIERQLTAMQPRFEPDAPAVPWPRVKPGSTSKHQPSDNARTSLVRLTGVDLVAVTCLSASSAQTSLAEVGTEMSKFPTVKHCCSWLGLAPHHDISGGSVWRSRTLKVVNRATQALRQAAQSVARSDSAFGASCRAMRARLGPQQALVATAHKIARVGYHLLKYHEAFTEESAAASTRQRRERELKHLIRRASTLGYALTPVAASSPACVV